MSYLTEPLDYSRFLSHYLRLRGGRLFSRFEYRKDNLVSGLTTQRGRWVRPFIHSGVMGLVLIGITIGPTIVQEATSDKLPAAPNRSKSNSGEDFGFGTGGGMVLGTFTSSLSETVGTQISEKPRAEVILYEIQTGDTVSQIADKFGISDDTIYWENNITAKTKLKPGDTLRILPITGIDHSVSRGETIHSIAKKFDVSPQAIVDWPFNSFTNDETFELAVGQSLIIPHGVKPNEVQVSPRSNLARQTPDAGSVVASGSWVWPAQGRLTQYYAWYHPAIDIANKNGPVAVAADSGTVVSVISQGWGYGNHVIVDHGNGFQTLYAHLSSFRVNQGQTIGKGSPIGVMGSTGRSTGTHLHFEIRQSGISQNPLNYLK